MLSSQQQDKAPLSPQRVSAVLSARELGLLGRSAAAAAAAAVDSLQGVPLPTAPAGPTAGHLPGVRAAYRVAAASSVADSGPPRMYRGGIDLAREIASLHHQRQDAQPLQQQQQVVGAHLGAPHPPAAAAVTGSSALRSDSFDVDELLGWSQTQL